MKRVLLLHGYSQNGPMFYKRMSAIRKAAEKSCEFVFLDAPHILQPVDLPEDISSLDRPSPTPMDDPALIPRAWWRANEGRTVYIGVHESLEYVRNFLKTQEKPFQAVFGFSQGAGMAALLTAILERPSVYTPVSFIDPITALPVHPPFETAIFGSGFAPVPAEFSALFSTSPRTIASHTKVLHVIGEMDPIVSKSRSQTLVDACIEENSRVEFHDGGHFIPSKASWRNFFAAFLASDDPLNVPSPTSPVVPQPSL